MICWKIVRMLKDIWHGRIGKLTALKVGNSPGPGWIHSRILIEPQEKITVRITNLPALWMQRNRG